MKLKPGYLFALSIVFFSATILGMRYNNIEVNNLKAQLIERDRAGEDVRAEVEGDLKDFTFNRMNADVQITLDGEYARAIAEYQSQRDSAVDGSVYEDAVAACDRENQSAQENAECVEDYVGARLGGGQGEASEPHVGAYTYTFYSPIWTYDLPGVALVLAIVSLLLALTLYLRDTVRSMSKKQ